MGASLEENLTTMHFMMTLLNLPILTTPPTRMTLTMLIDWQLLWYWRIWQQLWLKWLESYDSDDSFKSDDFDDSDNWVNMTTLFDNLKTVMILTTLKTSMILILFTDDFENFTPKTMTSQTTLNNFTESHFGKWLFEEHLGAKSRASSIKKRSCWSSQSH